MPSSTSESPVAAAQPFSGSDLPPDHWDLRIQPHNKWLDLHLADVWRYRDLLWLFVRRDFVSIYKQTILGPLWFFIQPLFTVVSNIIQFGIQVALFLGFLGYYLANGSTIAPAQRARRVVAGASRARPFSGRLARSHWAVH